MKKHNELISNFREIPYNLTLKDHANEMRNNSTKGEIKFWCELLRKKQTGYQFDRQKIIGHYIVDFYCAKLKLVVEIDGISHMKKKKYDEHRNAILEAFGLKVLHYDDQDVQNNFWFVEKDFKEQLTKRINELSK